MLYFKISASNLGLRISLEVNVDGYMLELFKSMDYC
jgi:hypothetical protein